MAEEYVGMLKEFGNVFRYNQLTQKYPDGRGDINEVIQLAMQEMIIGGASQKHVEELQSDMVRKYQSGDRTFFSKPLTINAEKSKKRFESYVNKNLEGILRETPEKIISEHLVPYVLQNKKFEEGDYKRFGEIQLKEIPKLKDDSKNVIDIANKNMKDKEQEYVADYSHDPVLLGILKDIFLDEERFIAEEQNRLKRKELELGNEFEQLSGRIDLKDYILASGITSKEIINLYTPILNQIYAKGIEEQNSGIARNGANGSQEPSLDTVA
jgi:hypothetical protein